MESGTSQATAHVAGVAAYFLSLYPSLTPAVIRTGIDNLATKNILSGVPEGTVNYLLYNGDFS